MFIIILNWTFLVTLAMTLSWIGDQRWFVEGCKCIPLQSPAYCQTDFLAIVKITNTSVHRMERRRYYSYQLVADLNPILNKEISALNSNSVISTALSPNNCGVLLQTNTTYMLGGQIQSNNKELSLFSCNFYVEPWKHPTTKSHDRAIAKYKEICERFEAENKFNKLNKPEQSSLLNR